MAERGQALTEYVLLLSVAVALSMALMIGFRQTLHNGIQAFNVSLETDLETCNLQEEDGIWNN